MVFYAPKADGRYTELPLRVKPPPTCVLLNKYYVADCSDLPHVAEPDQELCDLFTNVSVASMIAPVEPVSRPARDCSGRLRCASTYTNKAHRTLVGSII